MHRGYIVEASGFGGLGVGPFISVEGGEVARVSVGVFGVAGLIVAQLCLVEGEGLGFPRVVGSAGGHRADGGHCRPHGVEEHVHKLHNTYIHTIVTFVCGVCLMCADLHFKIFIFEYFPKIPSEMNSTHHVYPILFEDGSQGSQNSK